MTQEFQIGGVANGIWVIQTTGGAQVGNITFSTNGATASTLSLYDSVFAGTNLLNNITIPASGSITFFYGVILQNGLTISITDAASHAMVGIEPPPGGNPYATNVRGR